MPGSKFIKVAMFSQEVLYQLWNSSPSTAGAAKKVYMFKNGSDNRVGHDKINKKIRDYLESV